MSGLDRVCKSLVSITVQGSCRLGTLLGTKIVSDELVKSMHKGREFQINLLMSIVRCRQGDFRKTQHAKVVHKGSLLSNMT